MGDAPQVESVRLVGKNANSKTHLTQQIHHSPPVCLREHEEGRCRRDGQDFRGDVHLGNAPGAR